MEYEILRYVFSLGRVIANDGGSLLHKKFPSLCTQYLALNGI